MLWIAMGLGIFLIVFGEATLKPVLLGTIGVIVGIYLLLKGADVLIEGAVAIAERFGVSKLFIGLSLVAFGTSAPELAVSITASLKGYGGIAISNVVGSNVANILLCLGLTALFMRVKVGDTTRRVELPFLLVVTISLISMLFRTSPPSLSWNDGVVLLGFLAVFAYYLYEMAKSDMLEIEKVESVDTRKAVVLTISGLVGVAIGGDLTVNSVVSIAKAMGLSQSLFALTVVAVGTSLPELVTSLTAAGKGHHDLSVGNIVGSNIMNILVILGISSIVGKKLVVDVGMYYVDVSFLVAAVVILMAFSMCRELKKVHGLAMLILYVPFVYFIVSRG